MAVALKRPLAVNTGLLASGHVKSWVPLPLPATVARALGPAWPSSGPVASSMELMQPLTFTRPAMGGVVVVAGLSGSGEVKPPLSPVAEIGRASCRERV